MLDSNRYCDGLRSCLYFSAQEDRQETYSPLGAKILLLYWPEKDKGVRPLRLATLRWSDQAVADLSKIACFAQK